MGLTHLAILNTHPDVRWAAVCDNTPLVLKHLQQRMGFEAFGDYRKMFDAVKLDFAVVATPTASHSDVIHAAVEKGVHLFVEKPLTLSGSESHEVAAAAAQAGLVTQVGYVNRFNEVFAAARRLLQRGILGRVSSFQAEMYGRTVLRPTKSGWRSKRTEGGGCLYEFASHCVDLVHFLVGRPDDIRGSKLQSIYSADVEDAVLSTFFYRDGSVGQVVVNWSDETYRRPLNRVEVFGTNGKLIVDQQELRVYLRQDDEGGEFRRGWTVRYVTDLAHPVRFYLRGNEFTLQLDHFIDAVKARRGSAVASFADGAATDAVLQQIAADSRARA